MTEMNGAIRKASQKKQREINGEEEKGKLTLKHRLFYVLSLLSRYTPL